LLLQNEAGANARLCSFHIHVHEKINLLITDAHFGDPVSKETNGKGAGSFIKRLRITNDHGWTPRTLRQRERKIKNVLLRQRVMAARFGHGRIFG